MAKGKHAPAKGAIRKDKVLHPQSRKVKRQQGVEIRKMKLENTKKIGSVRLTALGEKLLWFHDNLNVLIYSSESNEDFQMTSDAFLDLITAYLNRFKEEVETITLKQSISKNRQFQHSNRFDAIKMTLETETAEFEGCGLEVPDLLDSENFTYFRNWSGELRYVQNIKLKRYNRSMLKSSTMEMDN